MAGISKKIKSIINSFYLKKQEFELNSSNFELEKKAFYAKMEEYWKSNNISEDKISDDKFSISKIQSVKIEFDIDKLEKVLDKKTLNQVIIKKYAITDFSNLIKYLKSCGVDSKKFKSFISIDKTVDQKAIDNLIDVGEIDKEDLSGTYTAIVKNPYFKVVNIEEKNEEPKK